jgi:tetratricopeptide (TPR) repeat protein
LLEAVEMFTSSLGIENSWTLTAMHNLAWTYQSQGRNADAARIQEEVLEKRRRILGEEHPDTLGAMHALALTYQSQGRNADAARIQEEVLEKRRRILGEEHPDTLTGHARPRPARIRHREGTRTRPGSRRKCWRRRGGSWRGAPTTRWTAMHALALTYQAQGRKADAARIQEEVLEKRRRILGEEHPDTLAAMHDLALTVSGTGKERGRGQDPGGSVGEAEEDPGRGAPRHR